MADIWEAYKFLNDSLKLNLDDQTLMKAEAGFKQLWLERRGFPKTANVEHWDFFAYLAPNPMRTREVEDILMPTGETPRGGTKR